MSRAKTDNTTHSYMRAATRFGWSKKKARAMMTAASRHGVSAGNMRLGELRDWFEARQSCTSRRIKLYEGYVFVFASTSTKCITVFKLPEELGCVEKGDAYENI